MRPMPTSDDRPTAFIVTVCFHALLFGGLMLAGEYVDHSRPAVPIEVEIVEPPPPVKKVEPKKEEPEEEEKVEEKVEEKKVEKKVEKKKPVRRRRVAKVQKPVETQPAPGVDSNGDAPAPVIKMPGLGIGTVPVARGKPSKRVGTGGTGTNTGGGGPPDSAGTGPPRAVSIAAIKKRARPLNPDLDTSKLYPDEAKRLGIEGKVKVFLVVDATGKVVRRRITKSLGHGLDKVALQLAKKLRFKPAIDTNDRPVADKLEWTFTFVLPR